MVAFTELACFSDSARMSPAASITEVSCDSIQLPPPHQRSAVLGRAPSEEEHLAEALTALRGRHKRDAGRLRTPKFAGERKRLFARQRRVL